MCLKAHYYTYLCGKQNERMKMVEDSDTYWAISLFYLLTFLQYVVICIKFPNLKKYFLVRFNKTTKVN